MFDPTSIAPDGSPEFFLLRQLDVARIPRHVAVIMDGNGRWAQSRGWPRTEGHRHGVAAVRETVDVAGKLGLEALTLYAFSTENWNRPRSEVWMLMNLLKEYVRRELSSLQKAGVRLQVLGRWREMDPAVVKVLERAQRETSGGQQLTLNIALNYSGRSEIVDACRQIVRDWADGKGLEIDEQTLGRYLYTSGQPDPDLLIRTSGEMRLSNFLLWQVAYSELWVTDTLWPDFRTRDFLQALLDFQQRQRRFGGVESHSGPAAEGAKLEGGEG
ncbi:MAG: isoprenyl transferase [Acidobacteriota bacterium]